MSIEPSHRKIYWQESKILKADRRKIKGHSSTIIWLTGLSASGKTTISRELDKRLNDLRIHTYMLDGDNVRHGLNKDLGFSREGREENIRRIAEVAKLFMDAGIIVICSFISPYKVDRLMARKIVEESEFIEVYLKCPLDVCVQRDPKGLYKKALSGELRGFTGIDDPYEVPEDPEIIIETDSLTIAESADHIMKYLIREGLMNGEL